MTNPTRPLRKNGPLEGVTRAPGASVGLYQTPSSPRHGSLAETPEDVINTGDESKVVIHL